MSTKKFIIFSTVLFFIFLGGMTALIAIFRPAQPEAGVKTEQVSQKKTTKIKTPKINKSKPKKKDALAEKNSAQKLPETEKPEQKITENQPQKPDSSRILINRQKSTIDSLKLAIQNIEARNAKTLAQFEKKVDKKLAEKSLRLKSQPAQSAKSAPKKSIKEMAKIYEKMQPAVAAQIISNLAPKTAVIVISSMKKRSAAKIMGALDPGKAIELSRLMAKFN